MGRPEIDHSRPDPIFPYRRPRMNHWFVYMIRCSDNSLYTGLTKDVERRVAEHNNDDVLGARYTRTRRPMQLVYQESLNTRSEATKREREIKRLRRKEKEVLISMVKETSAGRAIKHSTGETIAVSREL